MISLNPNNPWLPNNQQPPYDLATTSPHPSAYSALGTPAQNTFAVGTLPSTSGWDTYQAPYQAPAANTLLATNTQTYTYAPNDKKTQTYAPDTRIYAPETTINYDSTTNQYYITHEAAPAPAPVYPPPVYPDPPKIELPKIQYPPQESKKKEGTNWLPWLIGGGGILAALFLPKLFGKKDKVEAKAEATAPAKATPEAVEEKSKTPAKKDTVYTKLEINAHGDPIFVTRNSLGEVTRQEEVKSGVVFEDGNSSLSVQMDSRDPKNVFMKSFSYTVDGKTVQGDSKGNVTVGGKSVAVGSSAELPNDGTVTVSKEDGTSIGGFKNQSKIEIKSPNESGNGYENITLHARINKRGLVMYEFNASKKSEASNTAERVKNGFVKKAFDKEYKNQGVDDTPVTNKKTGRKLEVGDDTSDVA